jgi:DNA modification methylase
VINLMHGDCLEIMKLIPAGSVNMVLADPPYGTTACKWDTVIPLEAMWAELKRVIKPNGAIVMTAGQPFTSALVMSNPKMFKYLWVWDKVQGTGFLNAKKQPLRSCEDVCVFYRQQPTYKPQMRTGFKPYRSAKGHHGTCYGADKGAITVSDGSRYPLTRLEFSRDSGKVHPTQKPVALMEYLIRTYTNEGEIVLDFTMGSGTTGVACVNTGRKFIGIELDQGYFDIATQRINESLEADL